MSEPTPEAIPEFARFTLETAWSLGLEVMKRCHADHLGATVDIWLGSQRAFHAAAPGTTADNDSWVERKAAVVRHFGMSSADVMSAHGASDVEEFLRLFALPLDSYMPVGGAIPIRVAGGTMVGVISISGLPSDRDHRLALESLAACHGLTMPTAP